MFSLTIYKVLHITGALLVIFSLGGLVLHVINGGTRDFAFRRTLAITHGIGMIILLVAGFGMLARLGIMSDMPGWVIAKLVLWLLFGGLLAVIYRFPAQARWLWWAIPLLGGLAAYLALVRPF